MAYEEVVVGDAAIRAIDVGKRYKNNSANRPANEPVDKPALDGFSLAVEAGTVCGLLGPDGAGKTTAVRILATLLRPDAGRAYVAGADVLTEPRTVRYRIGLVGQNASVDEILSGRQNLVMFGKLYHLPTAAARGRADELLERFDLTDAADRSVGEYSGGMRRRLDLAVSLLAGPPVLFLDEPTTGLDPRSRSELWTVLRGLVKDGTTLLLTTQYLEEADQLADNIVVMDRGRIIAEGTPLQLKQQSGNASLVVTVSRFDDLPAAEALLRKTGAEVFVDVGARQLTAAADGLADMTRVAGWLRDSDIDVDDIGLSRPSLDDVFLSLTGHRTGDESLARTADSSEEEISA
jgi:ABC-2 type transport system ATP-binding protein